MVRRVDREEAILKMRRRIALTVFFISAFAGVASRAKGAEPATKPPDLSAWAGYYMPARGKDIEGLKPPPGGTALRQMILDHLQPWVRAKMEATDTIAEDNGQECRFTGPFKYWFSNGAFSFLPAADKIVMPFWEINTAGVRRIYLNRSHPHNLRPGWDGDSVGRWEGDTLVVDTIGFNDKSWLYKLEQHSEELRMVERIRLVKDGKVLAFDITFSDRQAFTSAYNFVLYFKKADPQLTENHLPINVCNEDPQLWKGMRDQRLKPLIQRSLQVK